MTLTCGVDWAEVVLGQRPDVGRHRCLATPRAGKSGRCLTTHSRGMSTSARGSAGRMWRSFGIKKESFDSGSANFQIGGKTDEEIKAIEATMSGDKLDQQFNCRYENLHFDKGIQHMDGTTALKYARSRHSNMDGGDFNRAERQKLVVTAIRDKINPNIIAMAAFASINKISTFPLVYYTTYY